MGYRNLRACVEDLQATGRLVRIEQPIDPHLEAAEIQRRVFQAGGPAIYFASVKGCRFPMVSNLFGTMERVRYIFRDSLGSLAEIVALGVDPADVVPPPSAGVAGSAGRLAGAAPQGPPRSRAGPETTLEQLPQLKSWPDDGGAYITLPQVYTEDPDQPRAGPVEPGHVPRPDFRRPVRAESPGGLHYQIHRGIAAHHAAAIRRGERLRVNVFVGGPPAMTVAAVMPLPEGVSELAFAGLLGRRRVPMICRLGDLPISAEADFCITGYLDPKKLLPEGPFGDHLGYYSLAARFPRDAGGPGLSPRPADLAVYGGGPPAAGRLDVRPTDPRAGRAGDSAVDSRRAGGSRGGRGRGASAAVWPSAASVMCPTKSPAARASCSTQANALLGFGQMSLAKYLWIVAGEDNPQLDVRDVPEFLRHVLERVDWRREPALPVLHDDRHAGLHGPRAALGLEGDHGRGRPGAADAAGGDRQPHPHSREARLQQSARCFLPGILVVKGPRHTAGEDGHDAAVERFCESYTREDAINLFPLVVIVDDSEFASRTLSNFLWTTFTRSNPAADTYGIEAFFGQKHWGSLRLAGDRRAGSKKHHAPPLVEDPEVTRRVDALAAPGGPLHGII